MGNSSEVIRRSILERGFRFHEVEGRGHALVYVGTRILETVQRLRTDQERAEAADLAALEPNIAVPPIAAEYHNTLATADGRHDVVVVLEVYQPIQWTESDLGTVAVRKVLHPHQGQQRNIAVPSVVQPPITPAHRGERGL